VAARTVRRHRFGPSPSGRPQQRDADRRVHQALADKHVDGSESAPGPWPPVPGVPLVRLPAPGVARGSAGAAIAEAVSDSSVASIVLSHRSALAVNANLREHNRTLAQHVGHLEDRLSGLLGG
jgi:hypothetical protein